MKHNNCQLIEPTLFEYLVLDSTDLLENDLISIINTAYSYDEQGKDSLANDKWDLANDIIYFIIYSTIIKKDVLIKLSKGEEIDFDDFNERWKIDCIRKHFACNNFDIDSILELFGFKRTGNDGIDFMSISSGTNIWEIG
ncbi:MAG TPA: hypothetical protein VIK84_00170 [Haloplasmataceae bacterium]